MHERTLKETRTTKLMCLCKINYQTFFKPIKDFFKKNIENVVKHIARCKGSEWGRTFSLKEDIYVLYWWTIKCLWNNLSWFNNCQVRDMYLFFTGCSSVHEKLFNRQTLKSSSKKLEKHKCCSSLWFNIRTSVIQHLHRSSYPFCLKFTFK